MLDRQPKGYISFAKANLSLKLSTGLRRHMKSNRKARHILGLNYKLSNQRKVVIEGNNETVVTHASGRKRRADK